MTISQQIITIAMCIAATMLTRFLPFFIFNENKKTPAYVQYLGKYLPSAVFGMLVIYCLKNVSILRGSHHYYRSTAYMETQYADINSWRHYMLYASYTFYIYSYLISV